MKVCVYGAGAIGGYLGAAGLFLVMAALLFLAGRHWRRRGADS